MKPRYHVYFYTLLDKKGKFETIESKEVVCVGISTKPDKSLRNIQYNNHKTVFVLLVKNVSERKKNELMDAIEEVRLYKTWYELEPLAGMIKKKCIEADFVPYKMREDNKAQTLDESPQGVLQFDL